MAFLVAAIERIFLVKTSLWIFVCISLTGLLCTNVSADPVRLASYEVRVGQYDRALAVLDSLEQEGPDASSIAILQTHAHLMKGDSEQFTDANARVQDHDFRDVKIRLHFQHAVRHTNDEHRRG